MAVEMRLAAGPLFSSLDCARVRRDFDFHCSHLLGPLRRFGWFISVLLIAIIIAVEWVCALPFQPQIIRIWGWRGRGRFQFFDLNRDYIYERRCACLCLCLRLRFLQTHLCSDSKTRVCLYVCGPQYAAKLFTEQPGALGRSLCWKNWVRFL